MKRWAQVKKDKRDRARHARLIKLARIKALERKFGLITVAHAARMLHRSRQDVWKWSRGGMPVRREGKTVLVSKAAARAFAQRVAANPPGDLFPPGPVNL
jgi:hypothetical protein